ARLDYHAIFLERAKRLGERVAELHRAFATPVGDPAFEPEPTHESDVEEWIGQARESARQALLALDRDLSRVPEQLRDDAVALLERREEIFARIGAPRPRPGQAYKTRYHGDLHLGQVLVVADDFYIVDFEGQPAQPLEQRRRKSSPLRDIAGMLRSINYAAVASVGGLTMDRSENVSALEPLARDWERRSGEAFLGGYEATIAGCVSYPSDAAEARALIDLFTLEKAFYEMSYELANRPSWVRIPLEGILRILGPHADDRTHGAFAARD
ncbi:MAG: alpha-amylase, partial [Candidatus Baltobacteraceae bacterium]